MFKPAIGTDFLVAVALAFANVADSTMATNNFSVQVKCCKNDFVLSDDLTKCLKSATDKPDVTSFQNNLEELHALTNATHEKYLSCFLGTERTS